MLTVGAADQIHKGLALLHMAMVNPPSQGCCTVGMVLEAVRSSACTAAELPVCLPSGPMACKDGCTNRDGFQKVANYLLHHASLEVAGRFLRPPTSAAALQVG
jgi:hypothetical protein